MDRDRILLTPGPLTTTLRTKLAMLRDWGSWDADFNALTAGEFPGVSERATSRSGDASSSVSVTHPGSRVAGSDPG